MKILLLAVLSLLCIVEEACAGYEERYDLRKLPPDLKPIMDLIGLWQLETKSGPTRVYGPPDLIDIAIHPIPKFGARAANITHTYFDSEKNIIRSDYGFMPVKNATKRDPRIHIAYLTTSSEGYSMMEQETVVGRKITSI